jgi:ubiquinone/menaquinone biosynthesis C-methylase UbiE
MSINITDNGDIRIVEIIGEQRGFGGIVSHSRFSTRYSRETLAALLAAKGETWLRNEIARVEESSYVEDPMRQHLERFVTLHGLRVLDFGCGCGSSSLILARLGAAEVIGLDIQPKFLEAARLRARDSGLAERIVFLHLTDTAYLPFPDGHFDAVVMNAVVEHLSPRLRPIYLREAWRVIKPGGHLFVGETPNRLWPKDNHTTKLWGLPYLPLPLARAYAVRRGRIPPGMGYDWLESEGLRGATYWALASALKPNAVCLNRQRGDDVAEYWERSLEKRSQAKWKLALKRRLASLHRLLDQAMLRPVGIPAVAFLPDLNLCFEKVPEAPS